MLPISITIPANFLKEEVRCEYTITREMKKLWAVEIDLLFQVKQICDRHGIKWFVEGGTLLGAARHKGFIPWDDDIDIQMLRSDYAIFEKYAKTELKHPYFLQTQESDTFCFHGHPQIRNSLTTGILKSESSYKRNYNQGIFIDIFVVDDLPDSIDEARVLVKKACSFRNTAAANYQYIANTYLPQSDSLSMFIKQFVKLYYEKFRFLLGKYDYFQTPYDEYMRLTQSYNGKGCKHATFFAVGWLDVRYFPKKWYEKVTYLPFEWFEVPTFGDYIDYLNQRYGQWKEFVKGGSFHGDIIADTEIPYTKFRLKKDL